MYLLKVMTCLLLLTGVCGNYFALSDLILRIHKESDSATVYFIKINNDFVSNFTKTNIDTSVVIFGCQPCGNIEPFHKNAILVVQAQSEIQALQEFIPRLRVRKFVIVSANSLDTLHRYFSYFAENKFTRIFGIVDGISYAYLPFADDPVQKLPKEGAIPDAFKNLNGFSFRTTVQKDIPRTFWYPDIHGHRQIGGCYGQIFLHFLQRHNATFNEIVIGNFTRLFMPGIINATINNDIDISMNVYNTIEDLDYSYPVKFLYLTVMVPLNGYVDPKQYFLRPFSLTAWIFIGLTLAYIILIDIFKDIYVNLNVDVWHSFSRTFLSLLNLPSDRPITTGYRFHAQVLLFAFIIGNIYIIYFTSFLTVFIKVKQYETIQDLIDNNVRILMPNYEWNLIKDPGLHPDGFENIVTTVDYATYIKEMNSMRNTSYAYLTGVDRSEFLIGLQSYFAKTLFHTTRHGFHHYHLVFLLARHSPFKEILSTFSVHISETGLIQKWNNDAIEQAQKAGFEINVERVSYFEKPPYPLTVHHLLFAWNCLEIGLILAVIAFIFEKNVQNFRYD